MGQICNPTEFRLGYNIYWNSGYFPSPTTKHVFFSHNIFIKKYIKGVFTQYALPSYTFEKKRNYRVGTTLQASGERNIISNPFLKQAIYFSHYFASFTDTLNINIFLLDQGLIDFKKAFRQERSNVSLTAHRETLRKKNSPIKFFSNFWGHGRLKKKYRILKDKVRKKIIANRHQKGGNNPRFTKWLRFNITNKMRRRVLNPLSLLDFSFQNKGRNLANYKNNFNYKKLTPEKLKAKTLTKLLKVLLFLLPKYQDYKKRFFTIKLLQNVILFILKLTRLPKKFPRKKMLPLNKLLANLLIVEAFILKATSYIKGILHGREKIFNRVSQVMYQTLMSSFDNQYSKYCFSIYGMHMKNLNAQFLLNFILFRLGQYIPINPILNEINFRLRRNKQEINGFKILVSGRLTRKERASVILRSKGILEISKKDARIEYASGFKILKFGLAGVKVWVDRKRRLPLFYNYKFLFHVKTPNQSH
jgi:hypothetical protein